MTTHEFFDLAILAIIQANPGAAPATIVDKAITIVGARKVALDEARTPKHPHWVRLEHPNTPE